MTQQEPDDDLIRNVVVKGQRTLPSADFEDRVMFTIRAELEYQQRVRTKLTASLRFFVMGIALGIGLVTYSLFVDVISVYYSKTFFVLFLFVICVLGVMNVDRYKKLFNKHATA